MLCQNKLLCDLSKKSSDCLVLVTCVTTSGIINVGTAENKAVMNLLKEKTKETLLSLFSEDTAEDDVKEKEEEKKKEKNQEKMEEGVEEAEEMEKRSLESETPKYHDYSAAKSQEENLFYFPFRGLPSVRQIVADFLTKYFAAPAADCAANADDATTAAGDIDDAITTPERAPPSADPMTTTSGNYTSSIHTSTTASEAKNIATTMTTTTHCGPDKPRIPM